MVNKIMKVKLSDGSIINISAEGDIYQNFADAVGVTRLEAKVVLYKILYGAENVETQYQIMEGGNQ